MAIVREGNKCGWTRAARQRNKEGASAKGERVGSPTEGLLPAGLSLETNMDAFSLFSRFQYIDGRFPLK